MIEIRDATLADCLQMGRLMVKTWLEAHQDQIPEHLWEARRRDWTPAISERGWRRTIEAINNGVTPHDAILVACEGDRIVGVASCAASNDMVSVGALYVLTEYQGRGIGSTLLDRVMKRFTGFGRTAIEIAVLKSNVPARRFYERTGGQLAREQEFDEEGEPLPEVVYRWELPSVPSA